MRITKGKVVGGMTLIHYHRGSDTLTRRTLRSFLEATQWTEEALRRLRLFYLNLDGDAQHGTKNLWPFAREVVTP